jgi:osmotically-inducible protein OsmY
MKMEIKIHFNEQSEVSVLYPVINRLIRTVFAVAVVCGVSACMAGPPKTPAERQADREMSERVQVALSSDQVLYSRHINVRADGSVVTLSGYVWTPEELVEAKEDARAVPGVAKVVDRMEVDRGAISDSATTR